MLNTFIKASVNDAVIYLRIDDSVIHELLDILYDHKYKVEKSTPIEFDYHIEYGTSYEMNSEEELEEFKEVNLKLKELRNEQ